MLILQYSRGSIPQNTIQRHHLTKSYTPSYTGLHTLDIYNYRNLSQTDLRNFIDNVTLAPTNPNFSIDPPNASASAAGTNTLSIDVGAAHANEAYIILGAEGPTPNFSLDGVLIHLAYDNIFQYTLDNKNTAMFVNTYGTLDANGMAEATFKTFGPLPQWLGRNVTFCALGLTAPGVRPITWASNPVMLNFIP